jgi:hypothetical protein
LPAVVIDTNIAIHLATGHSLAGTYRSIDGISPTFRA